MPEAPIPPKAGFDDMMLAMDVVDTLRYQREVVERELAAEDHDRALIEKVRAIYASQGIAVTDAIIAQGVAALREERFVYKPPRGGWRLGVARLYVNRGRWATVAAVLLALLAAGYGAYQLLVSAPRAKTQENLKAMPGQLASRRDAVLAEAREQAARQRAEALYRDGVAALERGDAAAAQQQLVRLAALQESLALSYTLRIVSRPDTPSGVWRVPDANPNARNYYLIVEAVTSEGDRLQLPVTSHEDGKTRQVNTWGLAVSEAVFEKVRKDKAADGIVNDNVVGEKRRGYLEPDYRLPTTGGAITQW